MIGRLVTTMDKSSWKMGFTDDGDSLDGVILACGLALIFAAALVAAGA